MAVQADDLTLRYSMGGGSGTAFVVGTNNSLGGAVSVTEIRESPALHNLFDVVTGAESASTRDAAYVDYRVIYAHNGASQEAVGYGVYIPYYTGTMRPKNYWGQDPVSGRYDTGSPHFDKGFVEVGVSPTYPKNTVAAVLATETTEPPSDITWVQPTPTVPLVIGDIAAAGYRAIYLKRTIKVGTAARDNAEFDLVPVSDTGQ